MLLRFQALGAVFCSPPVRSILNLLFKPVAISALLLSTILPVAAQETSDQTEDVVRVRTDLVTVPAIVTDTQGHRVFGLGQQDFEMRHDNRTVKLDFFSAGTDHVALAFLLDASGSAHEYLLQQREAALSLFSRFGPGSQVAVLRFSDRLDIASSFTTDVDEARSGFQFPAVSNRRTAIFDCAISALQLFAERRSIPTERRIIILTSDGLDTASVAKATGVIQRAQQEGISFYVIHFPIFSPRNGHLAPRPAVKGFRELAEKTGGRYFMVGDAQSALAPKASYNLSAVFKSIEEDLASQYLLGFYPDEASRDGRFHRVEVGINSRSGRQLHVRELREGYVLNKR
jgi:Ca-activated chloride channel family protein